MTCDCFIVNEIKRASGKRLFFFVPYCEASVFTVLSDLVFCFDETIFSYLFKKTAGNGRCD